jgi:two-component system, NtrC family, sensor histidine kinase KinB
MIHTSPFRRHSVRLTLLSASPYILAVFTGIVLFVSFPVFDTPDVVPLLLCAFLTAFALLFSSTLSQGELSPAHMVGIVAFLSQSISVLPAMTWAIFVGGMIGAALHGWRSGGGKRLFGLHPGSFLFVVARVTLSFWASAQIYVAAGGSVPLGRMPDNINVIALPLTIYGLVYLTLYFSIFVLEVYSAGYSVSQVIRTDLSQIAFILLLPMPFAVLGAEIFTELAIASQVVFVAGMVLIILALYALTRSEYRLRKQLDELRTLSVVTQSMRSHLNLEALLKTIYIQTSQLLNIDSFMVALQDTVEGRMVFPLVIENGKEIQEYKHSDRDVLIQRVLKTQSPLLLDRQSELKINGVYSWLGVPLITGSGALGVIAITSYDAKRMFTRDDLRLFNIIAASGGIAIENARLYQQQTERAEQLVTLNRIASLLGGTLSPDKVLDTIISSASAISIAHAVAVYLFWDDAHSTLPLVRSAGLSDAFVVNAPDLISFQQRDPSHNSLTAITVCDVQIDTRIAKFKSNFEQEGIAALAELPLEVGSETLGALVLYYRQPQTFSDDKVELFKTFANQAAQAINNARMYSSTDEAFQRSVEQLLTLAGIGRVLTATVDLKNICNLILSQLTQATDVDTGMVILKDEVTGKPQVISSQGYKVNNPLSESALKAVNQVMERGEVYRLDDVRRDAAYYPFNDSTLSQLTVPILRGQDVLGLIVLESNRLSAFTEEDSHFVIQVANQAVIAIDNARLFETITEARDRLRVLLDAMEEGIILLDERGQIELANPRIDLIGISQVQLNQQNLLSMAEADQLQIVERAGFTSLQEIREFLQQFKTTKVYPPVNYVVQAEHGVMHIRRQAVPVYGIDNEIIGILLVFYNKTQEEELARSREEISRMIVHDLRSPLTAVTTSLKLLQDVVPKDVAYYELVSTTTDASRRAIRKLLNRVDSLLDVSRMESGQLSVDTDLVELSYLVDNVRAELTPLAQELNIRMESNLDKDLPPLDVDGDKVERLILNLVDNALKYAPSNSTIIVRNHRVGEAGAKPGFVRIDVVDRGPGVPGEYKNTLFDRFVQIEGRRKVRRGVGLGLTFCRLVTEAHGGSIWIEDNPEGGSVFAFTLPVADMSKLED